MQPDLDSLTNIVGRMPREMVREVLDFAMYLERRHASASTMGEWTDAEDRELAIASDRYFDSLHRDDDSLYDQPLNAG